MRAASADEMMTVTAARQLTNGAVCFVGIGLPSAACNLARLTHAPDLVLIYESGTVGTRPNVLPLSIGDGELAETATSVIPLPEIFTHYLQRGRVDVGFLGANRRFRRQGRQNDSTNDDKNYVIGLRAFYIGGAVGGLGGNGGVAVTARSQIGRLTLLCLRLGYCTDLYIVLMRCRGKYRS